MRLSMQKKVLFMLFIICWVVTIQAQLFTENVSKVGTKAATFLEIPVGARAVGMGSAFVSVASDATALYWNVAGIASLKRYEIVGIHSRWIAETSFDYAGLIIPLSGYGTFGVSFTSLNMDDMIVRTVEKPEGTGEYFSAGDINIGLSYAFSLTERFALGVTARYIQEKIWHMTAGAFALDLGTTFRTDLFNGLIIGASITNFGTSLKLEGRDTRQFSPVDETKLGSNQNIPQNIELDSWDLPLLFQFGVSTNAIKNETYRWTLAVDALHPSDNYESLNVGTELAYQEFLFVRGGYNALGLKYGEGGISLGLGLTTGTLFSNIILKIDYAYRDMNRLENAQFFSVALEF
jgi:hypothetical protein